MSLINQKVLMSGADYFAVKELNPYENDDLQPSVVGAAAEHGQIEQALRSAGIEVVKVEPPKDCQDGVYTANWALISNGIAVMANLPNARVAEEAYADQVLKDLGFKTLKLPKNIKFSGQGDALKCGKYLFCGSGYRSDIEAQKMAADLLGLDRIQLQTIPLLDRSAKPIINKVSGWPDSFFYDIDLAISIIREDLIAYCPEAFTPESRRIIESIPIEKIKVSFAEAKQAFACNLISTGQTVIMSASAPELRSNLEKNGLKVIPIKALELAKGGGYIRCTTLTLS